MNRRPAEVYRTSDQGIIDAYTERVEQIYQWNKKVHDFAEKVTGDPRVWTHTAFGRDRLTGLHLAKDRDVPEGWRRHARHGEAIIPKRNTKAGREAGERFDALATAPSYLEPLDGMPGTARVEGPDWTTQLYTPGIRMRDGAIEVSWACEVPEPVGPQWTKIPLSQWHAEREAEEARDGQ